MAFIKQTFVDGVTVVQASWLNGIQEVVGANAVAPEYSPLQTYAVGTLVAHNSQLYICTTAIASPEEWTSGHWMATSLQALVSEQKGVYWCTYGTTTYSQVANALDKQMLPICQYSFTANSTQYKGLALYTYFGAEGYIFYDFCENGTCVTFQLDDQNAWTRTLTNPLVPVGRTVNSKALTSDITIDAEDIPYDGTLESHEQGTVGYEIAEIKDTASHVKEIFWCTGGITTSLEIEAALSEGKYPVLKPSYALGNPYLPYIIQEIGGAYNPDTQSVDSIKTYIFEAIDSNGESYRQVLKVNTTNNTEEWGTYTNSITLTHITSFNSLKNSIAIAYSNQLPYEVGDYVIYGNQLYRCKTTISTAENWNSSHWQSVTLADEVKNLNETTVRITDVITTAQIDSLYS
jgi:hypothetical protein